MHLDFTLVAASVLVVMKYKTGPAGGGVSLIKLLLSCTVYFVTVGF